MQPVDERLLSFIDAQSCGGIVFSRRERCGILVHTVIDYGHGQQAWVAGISIVLSRAGQCVMKFLCR